MMQLYNLLAIHVNMVLNMNQQLTSHLLILCTQFKVPINHVANASKPGKNFYKAVNYTVLLHDNTHYNIDQIHFL